MNKRETYILFAIVTIVAAFGGLTQTAVNSMLGGIQVSFGTPESISQWLTTLYMLVIGITVPLVTHLSRRFSIRTMLFIAIGFMCAGALIAAIATSFIVLLIARVLQAISNGITLPLIQALAMTHFPPGKNGTAMGIAGIALGFAPNIGPLFGGILVDSLGWRSYFWFLLVLVLVAYIVAKIYVPKIEHEAHNVHLDYASVVLSTLGFGALLTSFSSMAYSPLNSPGIWIELVVGIICLVFFIRRQNKIKYPLIHMDIFRSRTFTLSFVLQNLLYASFMGITLILPLFIVNIAGMTPVEAGFVFLPTTILAVAFNPIAGILSDKIGPRPVVIGAAACLFIGGASMAFIQADTPYWLIMLLQVIRGIGVSSIIGPSNAWGLHKLPMQFMIDGSTFNNAVRMVCASLGTALMMMFISVVGGTLGYTLALGLSATFAAGVLFIAVFFVREYES